MRHYTLAVDPPWNERGGGKIKRGADRHYPLLRSNMEIVNALYDSELWPNDLPVPGCNNRQSTSSLWMWATANYLDDAIRLCGMLGFEYVTNAVWVKGQMMEVSRGVDMFRPQAPGLGQRLRMCHEHLLYARAGKVPSPPPGYRMPSVIYAPRTKHSAKPQEAYDVIGTHEAGVAGKIMEREGLPNLPGARVEFFARAPRPGWEVWGNEV